MSYFQAKCSVKYEHSSRTLFGCKMCIHVPFDFSFSFIPTNDCLYCVRTGRDRLRKTQIASFSGYCSDCHGVSYYTNIIHYPLKTKRNGD